MKIRVAVVLVSCVLLGADAKDAKKDTDLVQGTWQATEAVRDGEVVSKDDAARMQLIIKGDKFTFKPGDGAEHEGTFKLDPTAKPKALDITPAGGGEMKGIYTVTETEYKMCISFSGERPTAFESKANSGCMLFVMKKVR
jgi:uncharacterized protein (TIGR03067 family)